MLAAAVALACLPARASATPERGGVAGLLGGGLVPSAEDARVLRERAVADEIARTLELVPGVAAARVHLRLDERGLLGRSEGAPFATAVIRAGSPLPDEGALREILSSSAPGVPGDRVRVVIVADPGRAADLVRIGPVEVSRATSGAARAALAVGLSAVLVLAVALIAAGLLLRRARRA